MCTSTRRKHLKNVTIRCLLVSRNCKSSGVILPGRDELRDEWVSVFYGGDNFLGRAEEGCENFKQAKYRPKKTEMLFLRKHERIRVMWAGSGIVCKLCPHFNTSKNASTLTRKQLKKVQESFLSLLLRYLKVFSINLQRLSSFLWKFSFNFFLSGSL